MGGDGMRLILSAFLLSGAVVCHAQDAPVPPCGRQPIPAYARPDTPPNVRVLTGDELASWVPADCTAWAKLPGGVVIALSGTFRYGGKSDELLARFGAVSETRGVHYWSVTDKQWRVLITDASALRTPDPLTHRPDFSARELSTGKDAFFSQADSRSSGEVVYRMRVRDRRATRIVLEMENVSSVLFLFVPLFKPRDMKSLYFLERLDSGLWGYFALVSANSPFAKGNEASLINRTAASFQHFIGIHPESIAPLAP